MSGLFDDDLPEDDDAAPADLMAEREAALAAPSIPDPRANTELVAHAAAEARLLEWWQSGTLPHTLVLAGPQGIGKATLAFRLARFLLTRPDPPGQGGGLFGADPLPETLAVPADNPVARQVAALGHPDLMALARGMNEKTGRAYGEILVDDVRAVPLFLRKTAAEGGWRVVVIDEAETLNRNAQNALLKILEEPPPRTLLILIAQSAGALIPTIRSRARVMEIEPLPDADFAGLMRKYRPDLSAADIALMGRIAGNAPGRALALLEQGGVAAITETVGLLDTLPAMPDAQLWTMAEKLAVKGEPDALEGMLEIASWALRDRAEDAARENAPVRMRGCITTLDALERHRAACDKGNLDRRHTALGALRILQNGLKAA